jgi:hypothetical protein
MALCAGSLKNLGAWGAGKSRNELATKEHEERRFLSFVLLVLLLCQDRFDASTTCDRPLPALANPWAMAVEATQVVDFHDIFRYFQLVFKSRGI